MQRIKIAIAGAGNIAESHIRALRAIDEAEIVGVADISPEARARVRNQEKTPVFEDHSTLFDAIRPDYVTICTPHYSHGPITMDALARGAHVFVEKPMAVDAEVAERCLDLARQRGLVLGVNFVRRMTPAQSEFAKLARGGFLGEPIHATMVCAKRFRTMDYYRSGGWRATWAGEGGGVLVNQAPHDLDFLIWTLGQPERVLAEMETLGHDIEVEDDVTALLKWPGGASGTFYASTCVTPGQEFFEIAGTKGSLRLEGNTLQAMSLAGDIRESESAAPQVAERTCLELPKDGDPLEKMHRAFIAAVRWGAPFVCPGEDGLEEVRLANAMLVSAMRREWTELPCDGAQFRAFLGKLLETRSLPLARHALAPVASA